MSTSLGGVEVFLGDGSLDSIGSSPVSIGAFVGSVAGDLDLDVDLVATNPLGDAPSSPASSAFFTQCAADANSDGLLNILVTYQGLFLGGCSFP